MKVCLLNDSFPPIIDGVANAVLNYAGIMHNDNLADVMVCTPKYPGTDYSVYPYKVLPFQSFDTTKIAEGYRAGNPFDLIELREMAAFGPDILHAHCPVASTYMARMLRARTGTPIVMTYHTKYDEDIAKTVKTEFLQKETTKALVNNIEACDEVWVVSEGAGENMKSLGYQGDYRVMRNGVDFEKGRVSDEEVIEATKGYDLPDGVPVFLFVGRIIEYKGIPVVLDAMEALGNAGIDYRMVFIGTGPDFDKYEKSARDRNLKCIFTGPIYDRNVLRAWNTRADLFLFLSTFDTNGLVVREAAACRLASVLVKDSCASEGVTDGKNGFLVDKSADDLSKLLESLVNNLDYVHNVGQAAMDELYYSWHDSVHHAHERYEEIIDLKRSGQLEVKVPHIAEHFTGMSDDIAESLLHIIRKPYKSMDSMLDNVGVFTEKIHTEIVNSIKTVHNDINDLLN